jgi:S1-C subfamily serine protease
MIEDITRKEKAQGLSGVRIQTVKPDTPAASVGFEAGDIIERMNSADMTSSDDVMKNLVSRKPGDICSFIVNRAGTFHNIVMEVGHKDLDNDAVHRLRRLASGLIQADDLTEA